MYSDTKKKTPNIARPTIRITTFAPAKVPFRNSVFSGANAVMLLVGLAMFGVFFYVSLYVQQVLGYSPIQAGATRITSTVIGRNVAPASTGEKRSTCCMNSET